jgi:predicted GTPase
MPKTNIILFGKTGVGKSSIVNMLSKGKIVADTSSGARGCTFNSSAFQVDIDGLPATLWDTVGLSANKEDRIPGSDETIQTRSRPLG